MEREIIFIGLEVFNSPLSSFISYIFFDAWGGIDIQEGRERWVDGLAIDGLRDIITTELAFYIRRTIGCISSSFTCLGGADF